MINLFTDIGSPQYVFVPVRNAHNHLLGVELARHEAKENAVNSGSTGCDDAQQLITFHEKITLIEKYKQLLSSCEIIVWVNVNDIILTEIMQDHNWVTRLQELPFLTLMVDESFSGISYGRNNLRLIWLVEKFPLALANFGGGNSSNRAVFDGLFRHVFLDRDFVRNQSQRFSFIPFANAIIRQVAPCCQGLMVSGIDNSALYNEVKKLEFTGMSGSLWPAVTADNLPTLLNMGKHTSP
ncbi:hypothetical protein [Citrobacter sp. JGM124]|uniref:hypothetical protein n=1 Tax=Citrobacter sp. JGM124 TaxID=2799789 RepID=UPI001BA82AEC|nr:hypothetical protein [Citrobacter sp. JGM124]MBS0847503.1 hypothetical protein [Citrobacter sp. JGM124]